jgi:PII-like signaling protein
LPLSSRARIEIYLPDVPKKIYRNALKAFEREFLETFGGCTVIKGIKGLYLSADGKTDTDKIILLYADTPFEFRKNRSSLAKYTDELRKVAHQATNEESILIVVHEIYHSV